MVKARKRSQVGVGVRDPVSGPSGQVHYVAAWPHSVTTGGTPSIRCGRNAALRFTRLICTVGVLVYKATERHHVTSPKVGQRLSSIQILLSDDFADWRRQVCLLLQPRPEWQVISEASDGLEAVQKAEELKPDIVLLDIGLPKLNRIEAARRIQQLSPSSKIIFLTQNKDLDIVWAALGTGALGYVRKTDARRELLPAVDAVLRGEQFISSSNRFKSTAT
jgi:CheY-like chemotaxis protein